MNYRSDASQAEKDRVERVLGVGDALVVGRFKHRFDSRGWEWSAEVARMHGYAPGEVEPTTELLLSHKHPDDLDRMAAMIDSVEDGGPFSSRHRIIDVGGTVREVLVVSEPMSDEHGVVVGTQGYYIDLSQTAAQYRREALDETLPRVLDARVLIEQAKGALMLTYGISADQAFRVLRWRSQEANIKLRRVAELVIAELPAVGGDEIRLRSRLDHVLLNLRANRTALADT
ncbi:PAS and ANTAR domain-containing protein [Nocardia goodfellowii]